MKRLSSFISQFTIFERALWCCSVILITASSLLTGLKDPISLFGSLIGVSALIFIAKGRVTGQVLLIIFSIFYGITSYTFRYYGEMITYLGMSTPMALLSIISWLRHPFGDTKEVTVSSISKRTVLIVGSLTVAVTTSFYFILEALGNAKLTVSTLSIATSFFAASLTFLRSPYFALAYAVNDLALVILWIMAVAVDINSLPTLVCFTVFSVNDLYTFISWKKRQKNQQNLQCKP